MREVLERSRGFVDKVKNFNVLENSYGMESNLIDPSAPTEAEQAAETEAQQAEELEAMQAMYEQEQEEARIKTEGFRSAADHLKNLASNSYLNIFGIDGNADDVTLDSIDILNEAYPEKVDYTDYYNTKLTPYENIDFLKWRASLPERFQDESDYDLRGFFLDKFLLDIFTRDLEANPEGAHMFSRYKKPNHPTFHKESVWSGINGNEGGDFDESGVYYPTPTVVKYNGSRGIIEAVGDPQKVSFMESRFMSDEELMNVLNAFDSMTERYENKIMNGEEEPSYEMMYTGRPPEGPERESLKSMRMQMLELDRKDSFMFDQEIEEESEDIEY